MSSTINTCQGAYSKASLHLCEIQKPSPRALISHPQKLNGCTSTSITLTVNGFSVTVEAACTILLILIGFVSNDDPAPLLTTISIGQPIFMSMKSTEHSLSTSSTVRATVSGYGPHICTPNKSSDGCRRSKAHSEACPYMNEYENIIRKDLTKKIKLAITY